MKKVILFLVIAFILFAAGTFLFIPSRLTVSSTDVVQSSENGVVRHALDEKNWPLWWNYLRDSSASTRTPATSFAKGGDSFSISTKFYKSADITVLHDNKPILTKFLIVPLSNDSTQVLWQYGIASSLNPFTRFMQYREAAGIRRNMDSVLANLHGFLGKLQNVYGIPIARTSIQDTLFVSAKNTFKVYPHTPDVYALLKTIRAYVTASGSKQTGNPIYNITALGNGDYQLMAAIPVDKAVTENATFTNKKMIKGSFMVTEVVGGEHAVDNAWKSLLEYFSDYRKTSMAINFSMLITDREYQPDSSKWITRLYQPVY